MQLPVLVNTKRVKEPRLDLYYPMVYDLKSAAVQHRINYAIQDMVKRMLSDIIEKQIKEREIPLINEFTGIKPDQDYYIADKALVVYFQLYDLTPYAYGFPEFPVTVYQVADIVDENRPPVFLVFKGPVKENPRPA